MFILSYSIDVFKKRTNNQNFVFVSVEKLENDGVCVCVTVEPFRVHTW